MPTAVPRFCNPSVFPCFSRPDTTLERRRLRRSQFPPMSESFAELFEQSLASQRIKPGQILTGLIISVGPDFVVVNVGLKSEAVIEIEQFKNSELGKKLLPPAPELPPPAGE